MNGNMNDKKNINYTNNDGAKFRYSASRDNQNAPKPKAEKTKKIKEALTKRAVFWRTNRVFAVTVLVAVIVIFSALAMYITVSRRSSDVEEYYPEVRALVSQMTNDARSLSYIYDSTGGDRDAAEEQRKIADELDRECETPFWNDVSLAKRLREKTEAVYSLIYYGSAKADVKRAAKALYDSVNDSYRSLGTLKDYAEAAERYDKVVSSFPLRLLSLDRAPQFEKAEQSSSSDADPEPEAVENINTEDESPSFFSELTEKVKTLSVFQIIVIVAIILIAVGSVIGRRGKRQ
ncbi:MAG: hypothetical protein IJS45_03135 [Clostridia bacterium]|nr:hypothetical protein [Clostridia bacterium]